MEAEIKSQRFIPGNLSIVASVHKKRDPRPWCTFSTKRARKSWKSPPPENNSGEEQQQSAQSKETHTDLSPKPRASKKTKFSVETSSSERTCFPQKEKTFQHRESFSRFNRISSPRVFRRKNIFRSWPSESRPTIILKIKLPTTRSVHSKAGGEKNTNHIRFSASDLFSVAVVTALVRVMEKFYAYVQREWAGFNGICEHDLTLQMCTIQRPCL